jgi:hypothetical protein
MASNNTPSETAKIQTDIVGAGPRTTPEPSFASLGIRNTKINEAAGVQLSAHQKLLVGSVLDVSGLFPLYQPTPMTAPLLTPSLLLFFSLHAKTAAVRG